MPGQEEKGKYLLQLQALSEQLPKVEPNVAFAQGSAEVLAGITSNTPIMRHLRSIRNNEIDSNGYLQIFSDLNAKVEINTNEQKLGVIRVTRRHGTETEGSRTYRLMYVEQISVGMDQDRKDRLGRLSNIANADGKETVFVQVAEPHAEALTGTPGNSAPPTFEEYLLDHPDLLGSLSGDNLMQNLRNMLKLEKGF